MPTLASGAAMIIFMHEERAYLAWLARHRHGYVVDWLRKPTRKQPVIHRSSCALVRRAAGRTTHWTTGRHVKACALKLEELATWARGESGRAPDYCDQCRPQHTGKSATSKDQNSVEDHITPLGQSILDYVLDVAVLKLDGAVKEYQVTVADVAQCLAKTPAQLQAALARLIEADFLATGSTDPVATTLEDNRQVYPTAKCLCTLPAFKNVPRADIDTELQRLHD